MLQWLLIILLVLFLFNGLRHWLERFGMGRLPGDLRFRWRGRMWYLPITSTVLMSLLAMWIGRLI